MRRVLAVFVSLVAVPAFAAPGDDVPPDADFLAPLPPPEPNFLPKDTTPATNVSTITEVTTDPVPAPAAEQVVAAPAPATAAELPAGDKFWFDPAHFRSAPAPSGESGLRRVYSAQPGAAGVVRLGLATEFFSAKNFLVPGDTNTRFAGTFVASWVPRQLPFLETFLLYRNVSNKNAANDPPVILTMGDVQLGVKVGWEIAQSLSLGADLSVAPMTGIGDVVFDGAATNVEARGLVTWDARKLWYNVPLRAHLDLGYASPARLTSGTEGRTTCVEEYATGSNRYHQGQIGFALEAPLPFVSPFFEAFGSLPINPKLTDVDGCAFTGSAPAVPGQVLQYADIIPWTLGVGARITALSAVTFDVGAEFGLSRFNAWGVRPVAPWNLFASVSYAFDPSPEPVVREVIKEKEVEKIVYQDREKIVERRVEISPPSITGKIAGTLVEAQTGKPVADAVIAVAEGPGAPVATDAQGRFESRDMPIGKRMFVARAQGYVPAQIDADIKIGETVNLLVKIVRRLDPASLVVRVKKPDGKPLTGATITVFAPTPMSAPSDATGSARFDKLASGDARVKVEAKDFPARGGVVALAEGKTGELEVKLVAKPKKPLYTLDVATVKLAKKLTFGNGDALLTIQDQDVLDQLGDLAAKIDAGMKLRAEVHVDQGKDDEANLTLSRNRADTIRAYFVRIGVPAEALSIEGVGAANPVAPRVTKKQREKNERVEFSVVGQ